MACRAIVNAVTGFMKIDTPTPTDYDDSPVVPVVPPRNKSYELQKIHSHRHNELIAETSHKNTKHHIHVGKELRHSCRSGTLNSLGQNQPRSSRDSGTCNHCLLKERQQIRDVYMDDFVLYPSDVPRTQMKSVHLQKTPSPDSRRLALSNQPERVLTDKQVLNGNHYSSDSGDHCAGNCLGRNTRQSTYCSRNGGGAFSCSRGKPDVVPKSILKRSYSFSLVSPKQYYYNGNIMKPDVIAANSCA